jgi:hypothetical protein
MRAETLTLHQRTAVALEHAAREIGRLRMQLGRAQARERGMDWCPELVDAIPGALLAGRCYDLAHEHTARVLEATVDGAPARELPWPRFKDKFERRIARDLVERALDELGKAS